LDGLDVLAEKIGSVNTVKKENGKLVGYNTAGEGFADSLENDLRFRIEGNTFLILGAGGAAHSVAVALAVRGAYRILISDLIPETADELVQRINKRIRKCARAVVGSEAEIKAAIAESGCLINASGVGMLPHTDRSPVQKDWLKPGMTVCDLTYNPWKTQLLLDAEARMCPILNGLGMVINQGARAFEIWTGMSAPVEEMKAIVMEEIVKPV
jgi:shikimate dehydrogenase